MTMDPHMHMGTEVSMDSGMSTMASGMSMNMNDTSGCDSMGMMMYFHTGKCEYILFKSLYTQTVGGIVGACFAIFALTILYEAVKVLREYLFQQAMIAANKNTVIYSIGNGTFSQDTTVIGNTNNGVHMMSCSHLIQTLLHMLQVLISYCLMLMFMTYNAWLCSAVILGAGVGYFLFGWRKAIVVDINEHCH